MATFSPAPKHEDNSDDCEEILEKIRDSGSKSLTIVVVGKPGCGKSTLIRDLLDSDQAASRPRVGEGTHPVTMETETYKIQVGDIVVNVCDTRGLFDAVGGNHVKKKLSSTSKISVQMIAVGWFSSALRCIVELMMLQ